MPKRRVSFNWGGGVWFARPSGKQSFNRKQGNARSTVRIFQNSWSFNVFLISIKLKNKIQRKCTNHRPLESAFNQDHECACDFVQKLIYEANRAKENMAYKLQSKISQSIHNEITIHKFQVTLRWILYQIPMLIALINGFEIQPLEAHSVDSARFWSRFVQTDDA